MEPQFQLQIIYSLVTIMGAGVASYIGVRVAIAEIRKDIERLDEKNLAIEERIDREGKRCDERLNRIEAAYFQK